MLSRTVEMSDFVWQTANLAGFISGCYTNDLDMIRASLEDVVIEPQRQVRNRREERRELHRHGNRDRRQRRLPAPRSKAVRPAS